MTTPFWCLVIVAFLPYLLAGTAAYFKAQQLGGVDNKEPRAQSRQLTGAGARAVAAQENAWEATALFTVAVVVAHLAGAPADSSATAASLVVGARVVHPIAYVANIDILRSLSFVVGFGACVSLIVMAAGA